LRIIRHTGLNIQLSREIIQTIPEELVPDFARILLSHTKNLNEGIQVFELVYERSNALVERWISQLPPKLESLQINPKQSMQFLEDIYSKSRAFIEFIAKQQKSGDSLLSLLAVIEPVSLDVTPSDAIVINRIRKIWIKMQIDLIRLNKIQVSKFDLSRLKDSNILAHELINELLQMTDSFPQAEKLLRQILPAAKLGDPIFRAVKKAADLVAIPQHHPELFKSLSDIPSNILKMPLPLWALQAMGEAFTNNGMSNVRLEHHPIWVHWQKSINWKETKPEDFLAYFDWSWAPSLYLDWLPKFFALKPSLKDVMDLLRILKRENRVETEDFFKPESEFYKYLFIARGVHINASDLKALAELHPRPSEFLISIASFIRSSHFSGVGLAHLLHLMDKESWSGAILPDDPSDFIKFIQLHPQPAEFLIRVWTDFIELDPPNSVLINAFTMIDEQGEAKFLGESGLFENEFFSRPVFGIDFLKVLNNIKSTDLKKSFILRRRSDFFRLNPSAQHIIEFSQDWKALGHDPVELKSYVAATASLQSLPTLVERSYLSRSDLHERLKSESLLELTERERDSITDKKLVVANLGLKDKLRACGGAFRRMMKGYRQ